MDIKEIKLRSLTIDCNVFMAPLAGFTCYPFRMLCYEMGAGLCFTEMISCNGLKYKNEATEKLLFSTSEEKIRAAQLLGCDPRVMGKMAASPILEDFHIIDINMGCPVPNVFKSGNGSALLGDLKTASKIIKECRKSGKTVTVKYRIGINEETMIAAEFAKMCEDSGAELITVHGRTRNMMYSGLPHFDQIEQAKSAVSIPVIANGGIFSVEDAEKMMNLTGADGIMIARYGLENPFIFSELTGKHTEKNRYRIIMEQIELTRKFFDETFTLSYIKKLSSYCMKKRKGTKHLKADLLRSGNIAELKSVIEKIFNHKESM